MQLDMKAETVSKWFINRRVKLRKEGKDFGEDGNGLEEEEGMNPNRKKGTDRLRGITTKSYSF